MFDKILIANRGEIACRVIRTARRLGVTTVAVYSDADAQARHVLLADEALRIGTAEAKDSYLRGDRIIAAAQATGAQAVHPGYGFLSENADFAQACADAGLVFIGPPAAAIRAMGSKSAAKTLMQQAGVPLLPGYHGDDQDIALLQKEAGKIGYPVLIKASAGGGGKGMRIVEKAADFAAALASCQREARGAFGDDKVLIEKYLQRPRHIEMQIFADTQGHTVHLFERDCSVQRRHQKVLEEAPAPGMTAARRAAMGAAAVAAAKSVGYVGAGTVEFIVPGLGITDGGAPADIFYFMEMNTRLQVEHPVTEMITSLDLVEWQLRVAAGEALPLVQEQVRIRGHALEARIYAEDASHGFLPATGRIHHLATPSESAHVRIDTGINAGDTITPWYDPMIAKLIVWDEDRAAALARMRGALAGFEVAGVTTNTGFLGRLLGCKAFADADLDTGLIARNHAALLAPQQAPGDIVLALASCAELLHQQAAGRQHAAATSDPASPWALADGWRLNEDKHHALCFYADGLNDGQQTTVTVHFRAIGWEIELSGVRRRLRGEQLAGGRLAIWLDDCAVSGTVVRHGTRFDVFHGAEHRCLELRDPFADAANAEEETGNLAAPMPGKVIAVLVKPGETVTRGAALLILEAMKMEHTICAPFEGTVTAVHFQAGEQVSEGAELLSLAALTALAAPGPSLSAATPTSTNPAKP